MTARCNLIIDSCCDLPIEMVQREGIDLLSFNYIVDDVAYKDDFYQSRTPEEFYNAIREGATPSTSQASPADIDAAWRRAAESGVPTVYLCFASELSSNWSSAESLLSQVKKDYPDAELHLVDLKLGSTPEGLLILEAIGQRDAGLTAQELVAWAEEARYFIHTYFMVDDLDALRRGGRIPSSVATAGSKLDLKPLLAFDLNGKLTLVGAAHGRKKGIKQLAASFAKNRAEGERVVLVGNADCVKDANRLAELLLKEDESLTVITHTVGATIGSHVGADMISVSFWGPDRRESISMADRIANKVRAAKN